MAHWKPKSYIQNCPFCWESMDSKLYLQQRVQFPYGKKIYNAHKECHDIWVVCQELIQRGLLNAEGKYSDSYDVRQACLFVEKFFGNIMHLDKQALYPIGCDYHMYHD